MPRSGPQVSGRITEIRFQDGQHVNAGDMLFVIDPRPYQAAVDKAEADLATATANVTFTKAERERGSQLIKTNALSQETFDQRVNAEAVAQASVQSAQAALETAKLNVDYAYVKAPISGRISRAEITLGNLVGSPTTAPQLLTSIVSDNGVYADFEVDEQTYLKAVRNFGQTQEQEQKIPVDCRGPGDDGHVYHGMIESFDNRIDTGSGTIRARARFANDDGRLMPGMFVSVRMGARHARRRAAGAGKRHRQRPEQAFRLCRRRRTTRPNTARCSLVRRSTAIAWSLTGLKAGDRVILDGLQRLAPGAVGRAAGRRHTASN